MNAKESFTYEQLIEAAVSAPESNNLPELAPVVAMFVSQFRPSLPPTAGGDNMTSYEIVQALEDIASVSTNDVARTMLFLGFRFHVNELRGYEWAMYVP